MQRGTLRAAPEGGAAARRGAGGGRSRPAVTPALRAELGPLERRLELLEAERARDEGAPGVLRSLRARRRQAERVALEIELETVEARLRFAHRAARAAAEELRRRRAAARAPQRRATAEVRTLVGALREARAERRRALALRAARARAAREAARLGVRRGRERTRLQEVPLAGARLPGVSEVQRAALAGRGVATAADVHEARLMEVPELDPAAALALLRWRWELAARVRPDADAEGRAVREASRRHEDGPDGVLAHAEARCAELRERLDAARAELELARERVDAELAEGAGALRAAELERDALGADLAAVGALLARLRALD